jgi:putative transposase
MPNKRKIVFVKGEIYHVFNRSVANETILSGRRSVSRFLNLVDFYRFCQKRRFSYFNRLSKVEKDEYLKSLKGLKPLVDIYAYAVLPNHYHLLLRQNQDVRLGKFIANVQNGFAKHVNARSDRDGPLFQRPFKATHITTDEEFLHVSRYVHLNPVTSYIFEYPELLTSITTSFPAYLPGNTEKSFVGTDFLIRIAGSSTKYQNFVKNQVEYQRKLNKIKHLVVE